MSATPTFPMIGPDGTAAFVPHDQYQAAADAGATPSLVLRAPDGSRHAVPIKNVAGALQAGGMTEGQYQQSQQTQPSDPNTPGLASSGMRFLKGAGDAVAGVATGAYHAVMDQPDTTSGQLLNAVTGPGYKLLVQPQIDQAKQAYQMAQMPGGDNKTQAVGHALAAITPLVGPAVAGATDASMQQAGQGNYAGAAGSAAANVAMALIAHKAGGAPDTGFSPLSPADNTAVAVTKAVNPPLRGYPALQAAVRDQLGNVMDYAKRNGLSINNVRDLSAVAKGAADETQAHYTNNILGPYSGNLVPVEQGQLAGNATLGDVNQRIDNINQDMKAGMRQPTPGQTASALSGDDIRSMQAEKSHLTDLLHRSLGDLNGIGPEDVQATRVRAGQLRTIASESVGGANAVTRGAGVQDIGAGSSLPQTISPTHAIVHTILDKIPGFDPESIQGKKLRSALAASPIQPTGLQDVYPGANAPMYTNPQVLTNIQQQAQRAALEDYAKNVQGPADTRAANAQVKVQRQSAGKALQQQRDLNNNFSPIARYLNAKDL